MAISFQDADININDNMIKELHVRVAPQIAATESLLKDWQLIHGQSRQCECSDVVLMLGNAIYL